MNNRKIDGILGDIRHYFGFLFERGYRVQTAEYSAELMGSWNVALESSTLVAYITSDRDHIMLEFSRIGGTKVDSRIPFAALVFAISEGRTIIGPFRGNLAWGRRKQLERLATLLKGHIDLIEAHFDDDVRESAER